MGKVRFDHVGVVVEDLGAVAGFFLDLGFELVGGTTVEGEAVDRINGLDGVRAEVRMVRTPDGSGQLELVKYHAPAGPGKQSPHPANRPGSGMSRSRSKTSGRSSTVCAPRASTPWVRSRTSRSTPSGSPTSGVPRD